MWDVSTQQVSHTLTHHSDKVQAVAWNPAEAPMLLSGGFDRQACLVSASPWPALMVGCCSQPSGRSRGGSGPCPGVPTPCPRRKLAGSHRP